MKKNVGQKKFSKKNWSLFRDTQTDTQNLPIIYRLLLLLLLLSLLLVVVVVVVKKRFRVPFISFLEHSQIPTPCVK